MAIGCLIDAAEARVARGIGWEWRGKVWTGEIAGGCAQGCPDRVSNCVGIAIADAGWTGACVRLADGGNRPPNIVIEFRVPDRDAGIGHRNIGYGQESRQFEFTIGSFF